jgi:hypothetical protein
VQVYEKRPSGLGAKELNAHVARDRPGAIFAAARLVVGVVLVGLVGAPLGFLWLLIGVALVASVFLFVKAAGAAAVIHPALVLTGRPKWDGTRRTAWAIEADDLPDALRRLTDGLDAELGPSLTAYDEGSDYRGITRREAFGAPEHPVLFAWGVGGRARLKATDDVQGVWIRMEYNDSNELVATVLANEGRAADTLTHVAWRV